MNRILLCALATLLTIFSRADERIPWTTSRLRGSPEKPYNYRIERIFPAQVFTNPVDIAYSRNLGQWFVAEQAGKLLRFDPDGNSRKLAADFGPLQGREGNLYAFAFDPEFASNRFIYVCYVLKSDLPDGSHLSRFKVKDQGDLDLGTEELLLTWFSGGHNGVGLVFGPDGYLYISTGDGAGPNPPDPLHTGQDVSDLLSSLLRIDVRHTSEGKKYAIPSDNPFVGRANTRPEIYAFGFRNPWRFGIDQKNGQVWVADVGWELWELIYRVERGGNYGWSIVEGRQPVHTTDTPGPGPILPPIKDHPHSEAASITGGFVYHGKKFPALDGAFLYGDWETGKIWALRAEKEKVTFFEELTDTTIRVVAFAEDAKGEAVILDYNGGIYSLEKNPSASQPQDFPTRLSETGLFASTPRQEPAPGVLAFQIVAPMWNDHATAERYLALPRLSSITNSERPWRYPSNAVLARTISLEMERGLPSSRKLIETQVLHFNGDSWNAYSYRWNEDQTDANLVAAGGAETVLKVTDSAEPGGMRIQPWRFHSRAECLRCHNPWCGGALAFQPEQLSPEVLKQFESRNYFTTGNKASPALVSPYDPHQDVDRRARSYLHVNCSHCHRDNAGGSVPAIMNVDLAEDKMRMMDARPTRGTLDLAQARVVAPGEPFSSVVLFRTSSTGRSRMPYIGTRIVDEEGITLLREWITSKSPKSGSAPSEAELSKLRAVLSDPKTDFDQLVSQETLGTTKALRLAHAVTHPALSSKRSELGRAAMKSTNPLVRELFERFLPADARTIVSQATPSKEEILTLEGNPERGAALLADSTRISCLQCHQFQTLGRNFGPEFKKALVNKSRTEIIESILEPSRKIAPEYILYTAEVGDEEQISGIILRRDDKEIILRDAAGVDHPVPASREKALKAQQLSAMPEGLLAGLTAQDAADLVAALVKESAQ